MKDDFLSTAQTREIELPFYKYYSRQSKSFLLFVGFAMLYCLAYSVILIQEFSRLALSI